MAKPYKIPDFRKMYPEASEEVISVLRTSERKMQYQEYDLKRARNIVDPKTGEKMTIPSREDSYERLQEMAVQFPEENRSVEDQILKKIECEQLHKFLLELSKEEQWLIQELYFEEPDGTGGSFGTWIVTEGDKQTETEDFRETEKIILIIFLFLVLKLLCQRGKK